MIHVRQPNDYTCGPAVVSIVTGAPLDELIAEMKPHPIRGTLHKKIITSLRARGVVCGDRFVGLRGRVLPETAIVRVRMANNKGHVVVKHGETWFDPLLMGSFRGLPPRGDWTWIEGARMTSCLWIGKHGGAVLDSWLEKCERSVGVP